jgi:hypothetical protein
MHILAGPYTRILGVMAVALGAACGSGDDTGPVQSPAVVAKPATKSGDLQNGLAGTALPNVLRVVVTRDGEPASGVPVAWSTGSGSLSPSSDETDGDGLSTSAWTLGTTPGAVTATASVTNATGSPVTFTATVTEGGGEDVIVQVLSDQRFEPVGGVGMSGTVSVVTTLP